MAATRKKENQTIPRFMIAAAGSGSGKTLVTCALLRLLQRHGLQPAAFKCGPDYIDPMFHRQVLGIPSRNLDTFFSPDGSAGDILERTVNRYHAEIAVIEGVMGYFDGTGLTGMEASSRELAEQTQTPVLLVVNAKGMGRSVVPVIKGFLDYEKKLSGKTQIQGVFLNNISAGMVSLLRKWIGEDTGLPVVGSLPRDNSLSWNSRHLGLLQPGEIEGLQEQIDRAADVLESTVDLELLLKMAGWEEKENDPTPQLVGRESVSSAETMIAVARDEAFSFYYEDNLEVIEECGARLVFFSPIHDSVLPEADGLILGGGYPELHAEALESNISMKQQILRKAKEGMPILAECGGFMYLQEYLELPGEQAGSMQRYKMCGVLPGTCRKTEQLVRFGYLELTAKERLPGGYLLPGHSIRGHEFHYFDSTVNGSACTARKPGREVSWDCMVVQENVMAGFPHLFYRSDPDFAAAFVKRCHERWLQRQ